MGKGGHDHVLCGEYQISHLYSFSVCHPSCFLSWIAGVVLTLGCRGLALSSHASGGISMYVALLSVKTSLCAAG